MKTKFANAYDRVSLLVVIHSKSQSTGYFKSYGSSNAITLGKPMLIGASFTCHI